MTIRNRIPLFVLVAASLILMNCQFGGLLPRSTPTPTPTSTPLPTETPTPGSAIDLTGSRWLIVYDDSAVGHLEYYLYFLENGRLNSSYTNYTTPENDSWKMDGDTVVISFNNGYAIYRGTFIDSDTIEGTASNVVGTHWEWAAYRR